MKNFLIALTPWLFLLPLSTGESWRWPEEKQESRRADTIKIDTKVRFLEDGKSVTAATSSLVHINRHQDELPFHQPVDTAGFYNRPRAAGRFPVHVTSHDSAYRVDPQHMYTVTTYRPRTQANYESDGTLDSIQYCKCVSTPDCNPRPDPGHACGSGQYLCCYKRPNKQQSLNSEYFNEIDDERPMLLPGRPNHSGPFPHPGSSLDDLYDHDYPISGHNNKPDVLVGPEGPTGQVGPPNRLIGPGNPTSHVPTSRPVLVGPNGPTGIIGPAPVNQNKDHGSSSSAQRPILVGPGGPTGVIGPYGQQRPVLVGPGGPTGVIGPGRRGQDYNRGILTGPGGPTGIIGPGRRGQEYNRGILTGPGGPTGVIGPGYNRRPGFGLLVGPGGPTGTIGPGRQLLLGPGGPTGSIGPSRYFGN